jgi:2-iminobutanoate/2-iminopropanoate deaminase
MNREVINPKELPALNPTYSQAIRAAGLVFVAGQIGINPSTGQLISSDIADQARQAIENTATILKAAGSSLGNVVSTTLYLTQFDQLGRVNAVYAEYFPRAGPAKLACEVSALYGGARFEIQAIAVV